MRFNFLGFFSESSPPLIQQSLKDLDEMLATTHQMFVAATGCLLDSKDLSLDLKAEDDRVNEKEEQIRRALLTHFSVAPNQDVAFGLTLNAIVQEVERMGDLAKSIAKVAGLSRSRPLIDRLAPLEAIRDRVLTMAEDTRAALNAQDTDRARTVMAANDAIKAETADYLTDLAARDDISGNEGVVLALTARFVGRFGSHLSNVASGFVLPFDQLRHSL
jgi:phosphate uptake regulator